jgi:hypothetical protein
MPEDQRARLGDYLAAGITHEQYLGFSWCRFGCGISPTLMGSRDLTDGAWVWPEGLSHYVREHAIVLPEEFIAHALANTTPRLSVVPGGDFNSQPRERMDDLFWHHWCAPRRSQKWLDRLQTGLLAAEGLAAADKAEKIAALRSERGLAETLCQWRGCDQRALAGLFVCAGHYLGDDVFDSRGRFRTELEKILGEMSSSYGLQADFSWTPPCIAGDPLPPDIVSNVRKPVLEVIKTAASKFNRLFRR